MSAFKCHFLILLTAAFVLAGASAHARKIAYRDINGNWHVMEEREWPAIPKAPEARVRLQATRITFNVTYGDVAAHNGIGFDDPVKGAGRRAVVDAVLTYIDSILNESGACDIEFDVSETDGSGALAAAGPLWFVEPTFTDPCSFRHIRTGVDPAVPQNPGDPNPPDISATVDFGWTWNDTTGPVSSGKVDLYSVLLHEFTHGLGFFSLSKPDGTSRFAPAKVFSSFDRLLVAGVGFGPDGARLWNDAGAFRYTASILSSGTASVYFKGTAALAVNGNVPPALYTPNPWQDGSSMGHWDDTVAGDLVMRPAIADNVSHRVYQPVEIAVLKDLGYTLNEPTPTPTMAPNATHGGWIQY